jgi:PDZ domain-containing protein
MIKKIFNYIKDTIIEEYKFIIFLILLYIVINFPVNYYITTGGGTSDVSSRIEVTDKNESKGSFNISYVTQLQGTLLSLGLSYIIPTWEREDANLYKYSDSESIEDINFRSDLDLLTANGTATYWAYTLANKSVELTESKLYVITVFDEYDTTLKVQDQILSVDGNSFQTVEEYKEYLQTKNAGDKVSVKIIRNKKEKTVEAKLYSSNDRIVLGVGLQYVKEYKTSPEVNIKFKSSESGPSGGLITTLEIYNQLTKKDLTNGLKIAGTGTIEEDGTIGQIGGVEHKILGAVSDDADIFLVPSGDNYKDAKKYIKKNNLNIKLIKVSTIQEAIETLEGLS